jgi:hypothetical protein
MPQQPELHSLHFYSVGDEVPLGRFVLALLRQLVQGLLKSGPEFPPVLAEGQRLHPAQLIELPLPARPHHRYSYSEHLLVEIHSLLLLDLYLSCVFPANANRQ